MPTYEYRCRSCRHEFEEFQRITAKPVAACPKCGGEAERLLSAAGLVFKGSGFYITDYKRAGEKQPSEDKAEPKEKPAAKPADAPDAPADKKKDD